LAEGVIRTMASGKFKLSVAATIVGLLTGVGALWGTPVVETNVEVVGIAETAVPMPQGPVRQPEHGGRVYAVSYSPDGKRFVSVGGGKAIVWDSNTNAKQFDIEAAFAAFAADGKTLFVLEKDEFRTVAVDSGKILAAKKRNQPTQWRGGGVAAFSRDGKMWVEYDGVSHHLRGEFQGEQPALADQFEGGKILSGSIDVVHGFGGAFNTDGSVYAGIHKRLAYGVKNGGWSEQGCLSLWNPLSGKRIGTIGGVLGESIVQAFAWSPSGTEIAVGYGRDVRVYDAKTLKELRKFDASDTTAIAWTADGKALVVARSIGRYKGDTGLTADLLALEQSVVMLDSKTGKEQRRIVGFSDNVPVVALAVRPDGSQLVTGAGFFPGGGPVGNYPQPAKTTVGLRAISLDSPKPPAVPGSVQSIAFSQDGKRYSVVAGGKVTVHDWSTGRALYAVDTEAAHFTSDNRILATMRQKSIGLLDRETGKELKSFPRPKTHLGWNLVSFSPDGKRYAAHLGFDVRIYDTETGFEPVRLDNQSNLGGAEVKQLIWSPDGKQVAAVGAWLTFGKYGAAGWEVETGKRFYAFEATIDDGPRAAAFSSDSKSLAIAYKSRVDVWTGGLNPAREMDPNGIPTALAFARDGKTIAIGVRKPVPVAFWAKPEVKYKSEVVVLDAMTGKEVRRFAGFEDGKATTSLPVTALAFSPDGKQLLAGTGLLTGTPGDGSNPKLSEVKSFSLEAAAPPNAPPAAGTWRQKAVLNDNEDSIISVAFAPDGKTFAAGGSRRGRGNVAVWDAATHARLWWFSHDDIRPQAAAVAYSPDSVWLAYTNKDGASVIETANWKAVRSIKEKDVIPTAIAFGAAEKVEGHKQTRLAFTDGRSVWAKTWLDEATEGTTQFGPLTNPPKVVGPPPTAVAYSPDGK
jgi:WD40 repeat protein